MPENRTCKILSFYKEDACKQEGKLMEDNKNQQKVLLAYYFYFAFLAEQLA